MTGRREKPGEIVSKARQVEVLQEQGATIAEAVRRIGVTQPIILILKPFELLQSVGPHSAILLTPAVKALFCNLHLPDCVDARHS